MIIKTDEIKMQKSKKWQVSKETCRWMCYEEGLFSLAHSNNFIACFDNVNAVGEVRLELFPSALEVACFERSNFVPLNVEYDVVCMYLLEHGREAYGISRFRLAEFNPVEIEVRLVNLYF